MNTIKSHYFIWVFVYIVLSIGIIITILIPVKTYKFKRCTYDMAKDETLKYLEEKTVEIEKLSKEYLQEKNPKCKQNDELLYCYGKYHNKEIITISLSNNYYKLDNNYIGENEWGIIYSLNDLLDNKNISIIQPENENYIFVKEKMQEHIYFYYDDYDGLVDIKELLKN